MKIRLLNIWEEVRSSYWFIPGMMAAAAILLSFLTIYFDTLFEAEVIRTIGFFWAGSPDGARELLSTISGSMITVAGVVFSITLVALSNASSQFGPQLLRNFMRDTGNQVVLGTFIASFVYSLLVLRTIRGGDDEFVPYISVSISILLALAGLGVLIYFIHHVALSIQAPVIISRVAHDLFQTIDRLYPIEIGHEPPEEKKEDGEHDLPGNFKEEAFEIVANNSGYLQAIDNEALMEVAKGNDLFICIKYRPGHFVIKGKDLALIWPEGRMSPAIEEKIVKAFIIGRQRTHTQDVEFAINQMVEVAVRSLSTGINDPFTAITCIDWLGAALAKLSERDFPSPFRYDREGRLRIVVEHPVNFQGLVDAAFNQIRQNASQSLAVRIRLLEAIAILKEHVEDEEHLQALIRQAKMIESSRAVEIPEREDRRDVQERYQEVMEVNES